MNLVAKSKDRYNGGVKALRQYGSSTITEFYVYRKEDANSPELWVIIRIGGKTPGERATSAKKLTEPMIAELLKKRNM